MDCIGGLKSASPGAESTGMWITQNILTNAGGPGLPLSITSEISENVPRTSFGGKQISDVKFQLPPRLNLHKILILFSGTT